MRQSAGSKARRKRTADLDKAGMSKKLNLAFFFSVCSITRLSQIDTARKFGIFDIGGGAGD